MTQTSRRQLLAAAASLPVLSAALPLLSLTATPARAQTSAGQQVPSLYRYKVGDIEVTVVNDGVRTFPLPDGFVKNASRDEINAALTAGFQPKDTLSIQFNPLLIQSGGKLTLIDTGNGPQTGNSTVGKLPANLNWAGVKAADIDSVVITHFHADHINGLRTAEGALAFPNAEILVPAAEWAYWTDEGEISRAPEGRKAAFENVRRVFKDIDSRVKRYEWDKEVVPGLTAVNAVGHTPGHTALVLASGNDKLFIQADTTNIPILFAANPEWQVQFDMDPAKAIETRRRIYDMVATERLQLTGYHYPFPATGFIEKAGNGYRVVPATWNPVL
ncbi:glyoxylase-like metal-dependent hydrolase (beta-lactamase superfamily II) [Angulomicrobium tetraedrale]|uniref:Glyoxylase-like metal-dependent hydrolase (Beta-lactamase superfamily II) n=1 Tax=Ancylobacter tetraedralis TaxID=217068 RepID=A0A839ZGI1_9HYPH|nr:MBL fold metallo-hydrolase [Ancylobacter tetraedralis]MBB3773953.1 glyoxylase-like metal-dependent hydrolase (beta-lactamase superfamily II) [Ancylobacter tetraedralis]